MIFSHFIAAGGRHRSDAVSGPRNQGGHSGRRQGQQGRGHAQTRERRRRLEQALLAPRPRSVPGPDAPNGPSHHELVGGRRGRYGKYIYTHVLKL